MRVVRRSSRSSEPISRPAVRWLDADILAIALGRLAGIGPADLEDGDG